MNETQAQKERRKHINRAKDEIAYLSKFVMELEKNTANGDDWSWVGDWNSLASDIDTIADRAESMVRNSHKWNEATK